MEGIRDQDCIIDMSPYLDPEPPRAKSWWGRLRQAVCGVLPHRSLILESADAARTLIGHGCRLLTTVPGPIKQVMGFLRLSHGLSLRPSPDTVGFCLDTIKNAETTGKGDLEKLAWTQLASHLVVNTNRFISGRYAITQALGGIAPAYPLWAVLGLTANQFGRLYSLVTTYRMANQFLEGLGQQETPTETLHWLCRQLLMSREDCAEAVSLKNDQHSAITQFYALQQQKKAALRFATSSKVLRLIEEAVYHVFPEHSDPTTSDNVDAVIQIISQIQDAVEEIQFNRKLGLANSTMFILKVGSLLLTPEFIALPIALSLASTATGLYEVLRGGGYLCRKVEDPFSS